MSKTVIIVLSGKHDFRQEINEIIRAMHDHDCESEGVTRSEVGELFTCVINKLNTIIDKENSIMATLEETQNKLAALTTAVDAEHDQAAVVLQEVVDLKAQVKALQDQIAAGTGATPADLDALNTSIDSILGKVSNIIPDTPVPAPTA